MLGLYRRRTFEGHGFHRLMPVIWSMCYDYWQSPTEWLSSFVMHQVTYILIMPHQGSLNTSMTQISPFFTAVFSHMKNLDMRGCHRSALEARKFLVIDSDDTKGSLFCIDYFALRWEQYKWLERFAGITPFVCSLIFLILSPLHD